MAIKRFGDFEKIQGYSDFEMLPRGGYVVKILGAVVKESNYGQYVELSCDIAEGDYSNYYMNDWKRQTVETKKWHCISFLNVPKDDGTEQDGWTKRRFKTFTEALEESNNGYHFDWDESRFKGLLIGAVFNYRKYYGADGSLKESPNLAFFTTVQNVRDGKYRLPDDKMPKGVAPAAAPQAPSNDSWVSVPDGTDEELPFPF